MLQDGVGRESQSASSKYGLQRDKAVVPGSQFMAASLNDPFLLRGA